MKRWIVQETGENIHSLTDIVKVFHEGDPPHEAAQVWRGLLHGVAQFHCTRCSGPMVGMLQTCDHARAAKRAHQTGRIKKKGKS